MRRNIAFLLGLGAGLAAFGLLRRRRTVAARPAAGSAVGDSEGAAGLRRRLAEARGGAAPAPPAGSSRPAGEGSEHELEQARAAVYRDAQATLDEMRRTGL